MENVTNSVENFMTRRCRNSLDEMKSAILRTPIITDDNAKRCRYVPCSHSDEPFTGNTLCLVERACANGYAIIHNHSRDDADTYIPFFVKHDVCHKQIIALFKHNGRTEWHYATIVAGIGRHGAPSSLDWLSDSGFNYEMGKGEDLYDTVADFIVRHSDTQSHFISIFSYVEPDFYPERVNRFCRNEIMSGVRDNINIEDIERSTTFRELNDCIFVPEARQLPNWVDAERHRCYYHCVRFLPAGNQPKNFLICSFNTAEMRLFIDKPLAIVNGVCKGGYAIVGCGDGRVAIGDTAKAKEMIDFFRANKILNKMVCGGFLDGDRVEWGIAFIVTGANLAALQDSGYYYTTYEFNASVDDNADTYLTTRYGADGARYLGAYVNPWPASLSERLPRHLKCEIGMTCKVP